jgi:hypothetical protein
MVDVHLPTTDGRTVIMSRSTQPEPELQILLKQLRLSFPDQPPPRIAVNGDMARRPVVKTFWTRSEQLQRLTIGIPRESAKSG